jgi:dihydroflavonol-4-reductase
VTTTTALVTGATGFVGSHIARSLARSGFAVRALRRDTSDPSILDGVAAEWFIGNLLRPESLLAACAGVDLVFHCGGQVAEWSRPQAMIISHTSGTRNMLHAAQLQGVGRFVHVSSVAALGVPIPDNADPTAGMDERHLWNASCSMWPYGYAKHRAETLVWQAVAGGLDAVVVAPSAVFGAGDVKRAERGILSRLLAGRVPPVAPPGGLNAVHIDDVTAACLAAARRGCRGQKYLAVGQNLTHRQFMSISAEVTGAQPPRRVLPTAALRSLGRLAIRLDPYLPLPKRSGMLALTGYHFYFDGQSTRAALGLPAPIRFRRAAEDVHAWLAERQAR